MASARAGNHLMEPQADGPRSSWLLFAAQPGVAAASAPGPMVCTMVVHTAEDGALATGQCAAHSWSLNAGDRQADTVFAQAMPFAPAVGGTTAGKLRLPDGWRGVIWAMPHGEESTAELLVLEAYKPGAATLHCRPLLDDGSVGELQERAVTGDFLVGYALNQLSGPWVGRHRPSVMAGSIGSIVRHRPEGDSSRGLLYQIAPPVD